VLDWIKKATGKFIDALERQKYDSEPDELDAFVFGIIAATAAAGALTGAIVGYRSGIALPYFLLYVVVGIFVGFIVGITAGLAVEKMLIRTSQFVAWVRRRRLKMPHFSKGALTLRKRASR
jgi:hypothetical protein